MDLGTAVRGKSLELEGKKALRKLFSRCGWEENEDLEYEYAMLFVWFRKNKDGEERWAPDIRVFRGPQSELEGSTQRPRITTQLALM